MRTFLLLVIPFAFGGVAGCIEQEVLDADTITPGVWDVRANSDHIMVWAHNLRSKEVDIEWSMTGLPDGWRVMFDRSGTTLAAVGTKGQGPSGYTYPDWGWTMARLQLPDGVSSGTVNATLETGHSSTPVTIHVQPNRSTVSRAGDSVEVRYDGRFHDNGQPFDDGEFPTVLGSQQTVVGFDNGLQGLAVGEQAILVIPPAFAYGFDNTDPGYVKFNGRFLRFTVTITSNAGSQG